MEEINEIKNIRICSICGLEDQPCEKNRRQCRSCLTKRRNLAAKTKGYYVEYCQLNKEKFIIRKYIMQKKMKKKML